MVILGDGNINQQKPEEKKQVEEKKVADKKGEQKQTSGKKVTGIVAGIMAIIMVMGYIAYIIRDKHNVPELEGTLMELIDETKDIGLFDNVISIEKDGKVDIEDLCKLEDCLRILNLLESVDLKQNGELYSVSTEEAEALASITPEQVELLIVKLESEDIMFQPRAEILQELQHIEKTNKQWLVDNGLSILEEALIQLTKAKCCEVTGIPAANYQDITIEPLQTKDSVSFNLNIKDSKTGASMSCPVGGIVEDWCELLYNIQLYSSQRPIKPTEAEFEQTYLVTKEYVDEGIELIRARLYITPVYTGTEITSDNDYHDVKKYIKESTTESTAN